MGDRANIHIVEEDGGDLYFYTHWDGFVLPTILARALDRGRGRWSDESYLARIIFSEMVKRDVEGETGYGISTYRTDYEYDDLVVSPVGKTVTDRDGSVLSFEDFIEKYQELP